jgi:hypothetical protein
MATTPEALEVSLAELAALLDRYREPAWAATVRRVASQAAMAWSADGPSEAARVVLGLFEGGLGGFGDVVLEEDGRVASEAQRRLASLQHTVFEQARNALSSRDIPAR